MKAVLLDKITEGKNVVLSECPVPEARPGWVLVKVKAFGQKVVALMGGMGRSFNGSYAEYALLPKRIVCKVNGKIIVKL